MQHRAVPSVRPLAGHPLWLLSRYLLCEAAPSRALRAAVPVLRQLLRQTAAAGSLPAAQLRLRLLSHQTVAACAQVLRTLVCVPAAWLSNLPIVRWPVEFTLPAGA